jgi:RNA polymerase sigma-70 factor (ECF subfamily)
MLRVLEALSPAERTAFVLHDVFGHSFAEVAEAVGRTPQAARQLASRARRHVEAGRPRFPATADQQREVVAAFAVATAEGDIDRLVSLLDPDVTLTTDGGGRVVAARRPLHGAPRVAKTLVAFARKGAPQGGRGAIVDVNGHPGLLIESGGVRSVFAFAVDAGRITEIDIVRNPDKLGHVGAVIGQVALELEPWDEA